MSNKDFHDDLLVFSVKSEEKKHHGFHTKKNIHSSKQLGILQLKPTHACVSRSLKVDLSITKSTRFGLSGGKVQVPRTVHVRDVGGVTPMKIQPPP